MATENAVDSFPEDDDEFMAEWTAFGDRVAADRERLKEYSQEHQRRVRKDQLRRVADMTDADIALLQEIRAEGIESQEAVVGTAGGDE